MKTPCKRHKVQYIKKHMAKKVNKEIPFCSLAATDVSDFIYFPGLSSVLQHIPCCMQVLDKQTSNCLLLHILQSSSEKSVKQKKPFSMTSYSKTSLWKINVALTGWAGQCPALLFYHAYMLTLVSFCVFSPSTRWMCVPAMSRQNKTQYVSAAVQSNSRLSLVSGPWVGSYSLLLCSRLKWCSPNWP